MQNQDPPISDPLNQNLSVPAVPNPLSPDPLNPPVNVNHSTQEVDPQQPMDQHLGHLVFNDHERDEAGRPHIEGQYV